MSHHAPTYTHIFEVSGRGPFPVDMLRYDEAFPRDPESAFTILEPRERRTVKLVTQRSVGPTIERWRSFGWSCVVRTTYRNGNEISNQTE